MFNLGMGEITVILLLILIFVGPKKMPDLATGIGKLIRQIRKTTADVKNEIVLDDTFRKPFEELRDAVTLPAEMLKRQDDLKAAVLKQAQELERAIAASGAPNEGAATPPPEPIAAETSASWPPPPPANVPPPPITPPVTPPTGTFPRSPTPAPFQPGRLGGPQRVTPPISSLDGRNANVTQALSEDDLLPLKKGAPPPLPPPLPGVAPAPGTKKA
jgi:sec-independent protein translocase protein TatB